MINDIFQNCCQQGEIPQVQPILGVVNVRGEIKPAGDSDS